MLADISITLLMVVIGGYSAGWLSPDSDNCKIWCSNKLSERTKELIHMNSTTKTKNLDGTEFTKVEAVYIDEFLKLDCNGVADSDKKRVAIGIQDSKYWYYYPLQDTDDMKCAEFPQLAGLTLQYKERRRISGKESWSTCPTNSVLVALYDHSPGHGSYFRTPEFFQCGELSVEFSVDTNNCREQMFEAPYEDYLTDLSAEEVWPMQCRPGDLPAAITALLFWEHQNGAGAFWHGIKCCAIKRV